MPSGSFTLDDVRATYKPRDAWWTVFLVDPYTSHLVRFTANRTRITPNQLSVSALVLGFVAAGLFWTADTWALIAGALVFHLAFVLDCMDGKIARLKGTGSVLGGWLDYIFDRIRVFVCALALFGGQYRESDRPYWLVLAAVVIFLDMLRYMNALQIQKVVHSMNLRILATCEEVGIDPTRWLLATPADDDGDVPVAASSAQASAAAGPTAAAPDAPPTEVLGEDLATTQHSRSELQVSFGRRFGWFGRMRDALRRHRVRPHLFSGIEFQMFVFILGPLTTLVLPMTLLACVLLLVFEFAVVYKLVLSARDLDKLLARLRAMPSDV